MLTKNNDTSPAPLPDQKRIWFEAWSRHALFEETAIEIQRHLSQTGHDLSLEVVCNAVS